MFLLLLAFVANFPLVHLQRPGVPSAFVIETRSHEKTASLPEGQSWPAAAKEKATRRAALVNMAQGGRIEPGGCGTGGCGGEGRRRGEVLVRRSGRLLADDVVFRVHFDNGPLRFEL